MDRYVEIRVLQVDGHHPHVAWEKGEDGLKWGQSELHILNVKVETIEIQNWMEASILFRNQEVL